MRQGAQGWCTGMTLGDRMWREILDGEHPWLIHVDVWQKPLQYCKVISLQLIKINGKKKKREFWLMELYALYPKIVLF